MQKRVLITGASGGIGSAIAKIFAINGYYTILHYNNNFNGISEIYNLLKNNNCNSKIIKADLTNTDEIDKLVSECGSIDILVNNAGISYSGLLTDMSDLDIIKVTNTNLNSVMLLTKKILPHMITKKSGKIINVSSIWGICGASCEVVYSATKAGIIGFTKALAKEVGPSGICVNCVAPGATKTKMLEEYSEETIVKISDSTPLLRIGEPSDIANSVYFLASNKSDFITGQIISPNGGLVI